MVALIATLQARHPGRNWTSAQSTFYDQLRDALSALPPVEYVNYARLIPTNGVRGGGGGAASPPPEELLLGGMRLVVFDVWAGVCVGGHPYGWMGLWVGG